MSSIASKIGKGSLWIAASRIVANTLSLVSTIVLARLLVPSDFGVVAIGTTILTIVMAATDLSLTQAIIHLEKPERRHLNVAWTINALRGLVLGLLLVLAGPFVADFYDDARLETVMLFIGGSVFLSALTNPKLALLKRNLVFWQDFVLQATQTSVLVISSIVVAYIYQSYLALVVGIVSGTIAQIAVSYVFVPFRPAFRLKEAKELFAFSGWLALGQIVQTINWRLDPLIIGKFLGARELGLFTVSVNIAVIPSRQATQPLTATLFPAFRAIRHDPDRLRAGYLRAQAMTSSVALPAGVLLAVLAHPLVLLVLGERWLDAVPIVQVLAVTMAFQTLASTAQPLAMATGRTRLVFRRSVQALAFRLPILIAGLYLDGLRGLLIARTILCFTSVTLDMMVVKEVIGLGHLRQFWANWRTIAGCAAMALFAYLVGTAFDFGTSHLQLIATALVMGTLAGLVYLGTMFGLWLFGDRSTGPELEYIRLAKGGIRFAGKLLRR